MLMCRICRGGGDGRVDYGDESVRDGEVGRGRKGEARRLIGKVTRKPIFDVEDDSATDVPKAHAVFYI